MKRREEDAGELAWRMFLETGSVNYYMLFRRLNDKQDRDPTK